MDKIKVMLAIPRGAGDDENETFSDYLLVEMSAVPQVGDCVELPIEYGPDVEVAISYLAPVTSVVWKPLGGGEAAEVTLQPPVEEEDGVWGWHTSPEEAADAGPANQEA